MDRDELIENLRTTLVLLQKVDFLSKRRYAVCGGQGEQNSQAECIVYGKVFLETFRM